MFKHRGQLNNKSLVDIFEFNGRIAKCGDSIDRDIDEFNTIFYSAQSFKKEILKIEEESVVEEEIQIEDIKPKKG